MSGFEYSSWVKKPKPSYVAEVFPHQLTIALILLTSPAHADTSWGSIGGGWKSLGDSVVEETTNAPAPRVSTSSAPVAAQVSRSQSIPVSAPSALDPNADNRALTRAIASRYASHEIVRNAGIDPREFMIFFEVMIETESAMKDTALSHAGAIGLAQLMPGTARQLGVNPYNKSENLDGGARYLLAQIAEFGTLSLAVAAYNAGPGAVRQYGGVPRYRETERHVAMVMSNYERRWRRISSQE